MPGLTPQKLREIYVSLPNDLRSALFSDDSLVTIENIGKKHNLIPEKIGILSGEIGSVMLGLTHLQDFVGNLAQHLGVDGATAGKIVEDVNSQIFAKVKESLEKIHKGPSFLDQGRSLEKGVGKNDILQEIERDHSADIVSLKPAAPVAASKVEEAVVSKVEPKYPAGDPYREAI